MFTKMNSKKCYFGATKEVVVLCEKFKVDIEKIGNHVMDFDKFIKKMIKEASEDVAVPFATAFDNASDNTKKKYIKLYKDLQKEYGELKLKIQSFEGGFDEKLESLDKQ